MGYTVRRHRRNHQYWPGDCKLCRLHTPPKLLFNEKTPHDFENLLQEEADWAGNKVNSVGHAIASTLPSPSPIPTILNTMQGSVRSRGFDFWQLLLLQVAHKLSCWKRAPNFGTLFRTQTLIGRLELDWKNDGPCPRGNKTKHIFRLAHTS